MWMLVNTTIFSDVAELQLMIDAMISQLDKQLIESCNTDIVSDPNTDDDGDDRNCEWEEYTETKEYLIKERAVLNFTNYLQFSPQVDDVIQDALFKGNDESARMTALIGFVDIQSMFDARVKKLFEEKLECQGEVQIIKKDYM